MLSTPAEPHKKTRIEVALYVLMSIIIISSILCSCYVSSEARTYVLKSVVSPDGKMKAEVFDVAVDATTSADISVRMGYTDNFSDSWILVADIRGKPSVDVEWRDNQTLLILATSPNLAWSDVEHYVKKSEGIDIQLMLKNGLVE